MKVVGQGANRYAIVCFKKADDVDKAMQTSHDKLLFGSKIDVSIYHGFDVDDSDLRWVMTSNSLRIKCVLFRFLSLSWLTFGPWYRSSWKGEVGREIWKQFLFRYNYFSHVPGFQGAFFPTFYSTFREKILPLALPSFSWREFWFTKKIVDNLIFIRFHRPGEAELDEYHPKATRTLFIGNLEKDVTVSDLRNTFQKFGEIIVSTYFSKSTRLIIFYSRFVLTECQNHFKLFVHFIPKIELKFLGARTKRFSVGPYVFLNGKLL